MKDEQATSPLAKKGKSNLFLRVVSASLLLPIVLILLFLSGPVLWGLFIGLAAMMATLEWMKMSQPEESPALRAISALLALLPALTYYLFIGDAALLPNDFGALILLFAFVILIWITFLLNSFRARQIERAAHVISATLTAALYVGMLFLCLALFKRDFEETGIAWLVLLMAMTWGSDTGAYFAGRRFGKHKLAPILSPKKTIEGAIGGFIAALSAAFAAHFIYFNDIPLLAMLILALPANFLAQSGDLAESLIKRSFGVKDSGQSIPGHGGMLDRVDALIFSAPCVYAFAYAFEYIF